jgi:hypothetical protein
MRDTRPNDRRRFLLQGAGIAVAPLATPALAAAQRPAIDDCARFRALIGTTFLASSLSRPGAAMPLTLADVGESPPRQGDPQRSFVLSFVIDGPQRAAQDTFRLDGPAIAPFAALLVPDRDGRTLHATFNRLA